MKTNVVSGLAGAFLALILARCAELFGDLLFPDEEKLRILPLRAPRPYPIISGGNG
jgi:hypothetical protein